MLYTIAHRGMARSVALLTRPDWMDHVGELTLVVVVPGGNQTVDNFLINLCQVPNVLAGASMTDENGLALTLLDRKLVVVAPVSTGWDRLAAGDWSAPIGASTYLFDLSDVDLIEHIVAWAERTLEASYRTLMLRDPDQPIFSSRLLTAFSGGACLGFRTLSERPHLFDGAALAGSNCAGWEFACLAGSPADVAAPHWRFGPPPAGVDRLHLSIGSEDGEVVGLNAINDVETPPEKVGLPDGDVDASDPALFFETAGYVLAYGPAAYYPLQIAWRSTGGVGDWAAAYGIADLETAVPLLAADMEVTVQDGTDGVRKVRVVEVTGLGHDVPQFLNAPGKPSYDWFAATIHWMRTS